MPVSTYQRQIRCATDTDLLAAYDLSAEKGHDVYDSLLLSLARSHEVDYLVTTDRDFATLCEDEGVTYANPVPAETLETLSLADG